MSDLVIKHQFIVSHTHANMRLDLYLCEMLSKNTRSQIQHWIEQDYVLLNQKCAKGSSKVKIHDQVEISIPPPVEMKARPEKIPLEILYEDTDLAVVNKPQDLVVHAAKGHESGTLVNALLYHLKDLSGIGGELRPGIVHRLDKGTSGLILIAKNNPTHSALALQFQNRLIQKTYFAIAYGNFKEMDGVIEKSLGRSQGNRKKISSKTRHGKSAKTAYHVLENFSSAAVLEVKPYTGRTHQIRAHLSEVGHPLVGDPLYGGKQWISRFSTPLQKALKTFDHQALHAWKLDLEHPHHKRKLHFEADIPKDLKQIWEMLKKERKDHD